MLLGDAAYDRVWAVEGGVRHADGGCSLAPSQRSRVKQRGRAAADDHRYATYTADRAVNTHNTSVSAMASPNKRLVQLHSDAVGFLHHSPAKTRGVRTQHGLAIFRAQRDLHLS